MLPTPLPELCPLELRVPRSWRTCVPGGTGPPRKRRPLQSAEACGGCGGSSGSGVGATGQGEAEGAGAVSRRPPTELRTTPLGPVGGKRKRVAVLEDPTVAPPKEGGLCGDVLRSLEGGVESAASCPPSGTPTPVTTDDTHPVENPIRGRTWRLWLRLPATMLMICFTNWGIKAPSKPPPNPGTPKPRWRGGRRECCPPSPGKLGRWT